MAVNPFDCLASGYDAWYDRNPEAFRAELDLARPWALGKPGLEVGVGTGRFAGELGLGFGIDLALPGLRLARARGVRVALADAASLPFRDGAFELVAFFFTLEFLPDPVAALSEARRVLGSGGRLLAMHFAPGTPGGEKVAEKKRDGHPLYSLVRGIYGSTELSGMLDGFRIISDTAAREPVDGVSLLVAKKT